jgi:hypothetical protein
MCGIIAYIGYRPALALLLAGLKRLEYRGYDSAGVGLHAGAKGGLVVVKKQGKVGECAAACAHLPADVAGATAGIAHTRWATHGVPSDANAHPHSSADGGVIVIHNGIIENASALRKALVDEEGCVCGQRALFPRARTPRRAHPLRAPLPPPAAAACSRPRRTRRCLRTWCRACGASTPSGRWRTSCAWRWRPCTARSAWCLPLPTSPTCSLRAAAGRR